MVTTHFTVKDPDGFELFIYKWAPSGQVKPKAAVQVVHGAAEHAARYESADFYLKLAT